MRAGKKGAKGRKRSRSEPRSTRFATWFLLAAVVGLIGSIFLKVIPFPAIDRPPEIAEVVPQERQSGVAASSQVAPQRTFTPNTSSNQRSAGDGVASGGEVQAATRRPWDWFPWVAIWTVVLATAAGAIWLWRSADEAVRRLALSDSILESRLETLDYRLGSGQAGGLPFGASAKMSQEIETLKRQVQELREGIAAAGPHGQPAESPTQRSSPGSSSTAGDSDHLNPTRGPGGSSRPDWQPPAESYWQAAGEKCLHAELSDDGVFLVYNEDVTRPMAEVRWTPGDEVAYGYIRSDFVFGINSRRLASAFEVETLRDGRYSTEAPAKIPWGPDARSGRVSADGRGRLRFLGA